MAKQSAGREAGELGNADQTDAPGDTGNDDVGKVGKGELATSAPVDAGKAEEAPEGDAPSEPVKAEKRHAAGKGDKASGGGKGDAIAVIIFGLDESHKAHASSFGAADAELAEKAARLMRFRALRVTSGEERALAEKLPKGKIFASGKGFVPFVKMAVFERLVAIAGPAPEPDGDAAATTAGGRRRKGRDQTAGPPSSLPASWGEIGPGTLALATVDQRVLWWPVVVVRAKGEGRWVVKWRDHDAEPSFVIKTEELALLHPQGPEGAR